MADVVATRKGYFGGVIREPGDRFGIPDDIWDDRKRRPSWCELVSAKPEAAANPPAPASQPRPLDIVIPDGWEGLSAADRKALAKAISGGNVPNAAEANAIISAHVAANPPAPAAPFSDAPAPVTAGPGNGVQEALGGPAPDWLAPGANPTPVTE